MEDKRNIEVKELNEQGKTLFSCSKYAEAVAKYKKALEIDSSDIPTYYNMTESYIMADRYDEAKKAMKKVLLLDKNQGEAFFHLGNIALLEENNEEARLQYAKAINVGFDIPQIYINLGADAEDRGDLEEAIKYYTKAIARDKLNYTAKIRRIEIYMEVGKTQEALDAADDLIETNPEIFEGHHYKFTVLAEADRLSEAEGVLDKAQKLFPDDQGFVLDRVKLLELQKKTEQALELVDTIKTTEDTTAPILIEKAGLLVQANREDEAITLLKEYKGKDSSEVERMLMFIYLNEKNGEGVYTCANKIVNLKEYDSDYFYALYFKAYGLKLQEKQDEAGTAYQDALKQLQQACSLNSGVLDLYLLRAICYREIKNYDKANEMLDYVLAVKEDIAEAHYIRYLIFMDLNDERANGELTIAKRLNEQVASMFGE